MTAKTRRKTGNSQPQHDSIASERESEESAEKKLLHVWQSFDQVYGKRWTESFGNDPLGRYKAADGKQNPRMDLWLDAVRYVSCPTLKQAVRRITDTPKASEWWLPDLQSFTQFLRGAAPVAPAREPERPPPTWVDQVCNVFLLRTIVNHGPFSPDSLDRLVKAMTDIRKSYNEMLKTGELPKDSTPEEVETIRSVLRRRFAGIAVDKATPEQMEDMKRHVLLGRYTSPTPENSNSQTLHGSSGQAELLNFD